MTSQQTLQESDRRLLAAWAADCAEHVLPLVEAETPGDDGSRDAIARARAFSRGEMSAAEGIRLRFVCGDSDGGTRTPLAKAAVRAAGQAGAVCHMGAHALGAAAYAAMAAALANPDQPNAAAKEIDWQLIHLSNEARLALRQLPRVGEDRAGPLGPGLLSRGTMGALVRELQERIAQVRGQVNRYH